VRACRARQERDGGDDKRHDRSRFSHRNLPEQPTVLVQGRGLKA
jgi:hypothetical protein